MSTSEPKSESSSTSTSTLYSLEGPSLSNINKITLMPSSVKYKHGSAIKRNLLGRAPRHYAQVSLGKDIDSERSPPKRSPSWNYTFTLLVHYCQFVCYPHHRVCRLSSDSTSDLTVELFRRSFLGKKHTSVDEKAFKLGDLLEQSKDAGGWHVVQTLIRTNF